MSLPSNKLFEFGEFRLDVNERLLWRGDEALILAPKVFDTLLVLIEKEGGVVSKSELMRTIWAETFVEESNLSQNIYTLRRVLGVNEQGIQFIETVPRRGYRFAAPVKILNKVASDASKPTDEIVRPSSGTASGREAQENPRFPSTSQPAANQGEPFALTSVPSLPEKVRPQSALRYGLYVGVGLLILALLSLGVYRLVVRRNNGVTTIAPIEQLRFQRLTDSGDVVYATLSPSGELLAFVRLEDQGESVWVKQIATGSSVQTLQPSRKGYRALTFSPDGKYLFFREKSDPGNIYQTSAFGSPPKKVAERVWSDFAVSSDGKQVAFVRRDSERNNAYVLVLTNLDGNDERELSVRQTPLTYRNAFAWSPDGLKLLVSGGSQQDALAKLYTVDVQTGKETELQTPKWRGITRALWHPTGSYFIVSARELNESTSQLWLLSYPDGGFRRLTNDLESYFWISLSADGRMLVTRQQRIVTHLWLLPNGEEKKTRQLTTGGRSLDGYVGLAWAPDGKIIFSGFADNFTDLNLMNADGSNRIQLTVNAGRDNNYPVVTADGRYIVFASNRTGTWQIWRMGNDGRNQQQLTFDGDQKESAQYPALSPDGAEVFFIKYGARPAAIWKLPIEGGIPAEVSHLTDAAAEGFLSISPDGKWLAYRHVAVHPEAASEEPRIRIGVLPSGGNGEPKLFDLPMRRPIIHWSADSAAFDYAAGTFNSSSLVRQPLDGEPQTLFDFPDRLFNFAWSRDRKNLVVARGKLQGDAILITNLP